MHENTPTITTLMKYSAGWPNNNRAVELPERCWTTVENREKRKVARRIADDFRKDND